MESNTQCIHKCNTTKYTVISNLPVKLIWNNKAPRKWSIAGRRLRWWIKLLHSSLLAYAVTLASACHLRARFIKNRELLQFAKDNESCSLSFSDSNTSRRSTKSTFEFAWLHFIFHSQPAAVIQSELTEVNETAKLVSMHKLVPSAALVLLCWLVMRLNKNCHYFLSFY